MKRVIFSICCLAVLLGSADLVHAQEVTIGPFLGWLSPNTGTICWSTDATSDARVRFGETLAIQQSQVDSQSVRDPLCPINRTASDTRYYYSIGTTSRTLEGPERPTRFGRRHRPGRVGLW